MKTTHFLIIFPYIFYDFLISNSLTLTRYFYLKLSLLLTVYGKLSVYYSQLTESSALIPLLCANLTTYKISVEKK